MSIPIFDCSVTLCSRSTLLRCSASPSSIAKVNILWQYTRVIERFIPCPAPPATASRAQARLLTLTTRSTLASRRTTAARTAAIPPGTHTPGQGLRGRARRRTATTRYGDPGVYGPVWGGCGRLRRLPRRGRNHPPSSSSHTKHVEAVPCTNSVPRSAAARPWTARQRTYQAGDR